MLQQKSTLPQVQATGLSMLALAGEDILDSRVEASLEYLEQSINAETTTSSMCFGMFGLTAFGRRSVDAPKFIQIALERELLRSPSQYKLALLLLAMSDDLAWLPVPQVEVTP